MKQNRTLIVMAVAVITAGIASYAVYSAIQRMPVREVEVAGVPVVVASQMVPVGTRLTEKHLRVVSWPASNQVPGAFSDPKELLDRGAVVTIQENEPVTVTKVAGPEAGSGLPPVIPAGMRAVSVRVNEVIGVAGFVLAGTRVDVLVTVKDGDGIKGNGPDEPMSRTVLSDVTVLTAGTAYDREEAKNGKAQKVTVVTLAVLPEDAERIALAYNEGDITLALRNPVDADKTDTKGIKLAALMRGGAPEVVLNQRTRRMVAVRPPAPPEPPPAPPVYRVETIRAAKRAQEEVR